MRDTVIKIKEYYQRGLYTLEQINKLLQAGKLTQEEYTFIVGEN